MNTHMLYTYTHVGVARSWIFFTKTVQDRKICKTHCITCAPTTLEENANPKQARARYLDTKQKISRESERVYCLTTSTRLRMQNMQRRQMHNRWIK